MMHAAEAVPAGGTGDGNSSVIPTLTLAHTSSPKRLCVVIFIFSSAQVTQTAQHLRAELHCEDKSEPVKFFLLLEQ